MIKKSMYFYDIELFAQEACLRWVTDKVTGIQYPTADFHKEIWKIEEDRQDAVYIVPRGFAKTTVRGKIKVLHSKLYQYEPSTLIISSKGLGEKTIGDIRLELETNTYLKNIFGVLVPTQERGDIVARKWRQKHLQLLNGYEIETVSKGEALRGRRPTEILVDDPQDDKDVKNPRIALEYYQWIWTSVYNMLMDGGHMSVPGTIISDNCFVNMLKQEAVARDFKVIQYPAILLDLKKGEDPYKVPIERYFKEGKSLWPERWPMAALKKRYKKIGADAFWQEFMHKPMVKNGMPVFDQAFEYKIVKPVKVDGDMQYFRKLTKFVRDERGKLVRDEDGKLKKEPIYNGFIGMDFSKGIVGGDYQAIVVRDGEGKLLFQYRGWIAQDLLAGILDKIVPMFKSVKIVPEENSALMFLKEARSHLQWYNLIYRSITYDKITQKQSDKLGWNTNVKTKDLMMDTMRQYMREGNYEVSKELHEEIVHYYFNEKGKAEAISPYHDDLVIADSLSLQGIKTGITSPFLSFV